MLTLKQLKEMKHNTIFAKGETVDGPSGIGVTNSGERIRWIAVRGGIHDWAIYYSMADRSYDQIRKWGNKLHLKDSIRQLVPCDEEAFKMYRH